MTAPGPDLRAWLDQLDEAHVAATPGPWHVMRSADERRAYVITTERVVTDSAGCAVADAAAIVAEHNALRHLVAAVRTGLALHQPAGPCSCGGRRWVDDENWSPEYPEFWRGERTEGNGLIPCGFCNHGGWNTDQHEPVDPFCEVCDLPWPCPTTAALTAPLTGQHTTDEEADRG